MFKSHLIIVLTTTYLQGHTVRETEKLLKAKRLVAAVIQTPRSPEGSIWGSGFLHSWCTFNKPSTAHLIPDLLLVYLVFLHSLTTPVRFQETNHMWGGMTQIHMNTASGENNPPFICSYQSYHKPSMYTPKCNIMPPRCYIMKHNQNEVWLHLKALQHIVFYQYYFLFIIYNVLSSHGSNLNSRMSHSEFLIIAKLSESSGVVEFSL